MNPDYERYYFGEPDDYTRNIFDPGFTYQTRQREPEGWVDPNATWWGYGSDSAEFRGRVIFRREAMMLTESDLMQLSTEELDSMQAALQEGVNGIRLQAFTDQRPDTGESRVLIEMIPDVPCITSLK